jgi:hypothetical protein
VPLPLFINTQQYDVEAALINRIDDIFGRLQRLLFVVAAFSQPLDKLAWSLLGVIAYNLVLIVWHKPGR